MFSNPGGFAAAGIKVRLHCVGAEGLHRGSLVVQAQRVA